PDILGWVREGELLLTTFYSLRDKPLEQVALIPQLAEKKLAALAIKPKRYIDEIPRELIKLADELGFPILQLPPHLAFSEVMEPLLNEILNFQTDLLNKSERAHNMLLDVVLMGGGLDQLSEVLAGLVGGEVAIIDESNHPLTTISPSMAEWLAGKDISSWKSSSRSFLVCDQGSLAIPLMAGGSQLGFVLAWGKQLSNDGRPYTVLDEITLERAAIVAALDIINARALGEVERRFRNEFVVDLVEGAFPSDEVAVQRARTNNWQLQDQMYVLMVRLLDFRVQGQKERLFRRLREQFGNRCISGEMGRDIIVIAPVGKEGCTDWFRKNLVVLEKHAGSKLLIGVGRDSKSIRDIKYSFRQARRALRTAAQVSGLGSVVNYDSLGVYRLFEEMSGSPELQAYIRDCLQPLLDYDQENNTDFLGTLRGYFEAGGNLKQVAKLMFVHYNTVIYRMERIQKLLAIDLDNPQHRLSLEVAVKALDFKQK
ncbi:MAG: PucR family transcriptional regulator ligand-binding domain-containing protein, partial [bacterium]|nr:PucR family transcriptional regulator ligand-binding domain-containing protein [bacterium]